MVVVKCRGNLGIGAKKDGGGGLGDKKGGSEKGIYSSARGLRSVLSGIVEVTGLSSVVHGHFAGDLFGFQHDLLVY